MKWRKTCIGLKFDLEHFYGPQTKFIRNSLYKHPVDTSGTGNGNMIQSLDVQYLDI